jgi:hypothetical protein
MKKLQIEIILEQLEKHSQISRNWCLRNYISRLGAYICDLNKLGWKINGYYDKTDKGRDFVYVVSGKPKSRVKRAKLSV